MARLNREDKILGCLLGAAIGDAMGAATELRTKSMILERFGKQVRTFLNPPDDTFARGAAPGSVTDDFSLIYSTTKAILENGGVIDDQAAKNALLLWAADESFYNKYVGPTTRAAVDRLKGIETPNYYDFICCDNAKATNGSAMKIAPAGFFNPGNLEKAVEDSIIISRPTHNNNLSIVGACAVGAAVSEAMKPVSDIYSIVQAGIYGAKLAEEQIKGNCAVLAGPDVIKRIKLAVSIGITSDSLDEATTEIADIVGSGLHISEAVPAVFGIIAASKNAPMEAVIGAVNIGSDTDTIASMTGAIMGALHGHKVFPAEYLDIIESVNGYDLRKMARDVENALAR